MELDKWLVVYWHCLCKWTRAPTECAGTKQSHKKKIQLIFSSLKKNIPSAKPGYKSSDIVKSLAEVN